MKRKGFPIGGVEIDLNAGFRSGGDFVSCIGTSMASTCAVMSHINDGMYNSMKIG